MKKIWQFCLVFVLALGVLVGCGQTEDTKKKENSESATEQQVAGYPLTETDALGNDVKFTEAPKSIITLVPSNTEILFALGLEKEIIAVSDNDDYPKAATKKEKIGGMEFNAEKIISLNPEVVFAHETLLGTSEAGLQQLRDAGLKVFVVKNAENFDETYKTIEQIGHITGKADEAKKITDDMKAKVKEVQVKVKDVKQKSAFVETTDEPNIYTAGKDTFMQEMFDLANIKNVTADQTGWFQIDSEEIVKRNPDTIIVKYNHVKNIVEKVKKRQGFDSITAVKNDAVVQVDANLTSRTGPRLAEGLEVIAKAVYPEAFE
ncbi:helical backbone metal receptor [Viridibacillus sp. FSL R5-0477]|uniref:Vitamin B12-binding protein n=1 Tax=Viridibacillus arenosi FSL R5-213 TaxID=1227360 RepID=W4F314_9BACL|nr:MULTISPECIES: helical backbone metal receptor [Viridibacillus]ETT87243.1 vitamin B12-binding protein [Viridibacillus arenosi FSL R5-213]OMC80156.1 ABC transporter substrate-binding protein [Viridibacillus sp. FSL H8-0123]OMC87926.1 ABC transporter substrate-binding protein [Viridibacillus sp. FSL H7-0596]OMC91477.1 ABC transporter substrate-binding protein [Viridibacillus arenosi]